MEVEAGQHRAPPRRSDNRKSELITRIASAVVMAIAAVGTAWIGGYVFVWFWVLAALGVLREWAGLVGTERTYLLSCVETVALAGAAFLVTEGQVWLALLVLACGIVAMIPLAPIDRRAIAGLGLAYAGVLALALPLLRRSEPDGLTIVIWLFAVVWGTDTMAYFGGRAIGGPKLAPRLSPSKTWSGFLVGVVSGATLGLLVAPRSGCASCVFVAGLLGGALAQAGDLFESSLKRRFGAKDAGSIIPGHGGLMDRLDGFIATSLFATLLGLWRFGPTAVGAGLFKW